MIPAPFLSFYSPAPGYAEGSHGNAAYEHAMERLIIDRCWLASSGKFLLYLRSTTKIVWGFHTAASCYNTVRYHTYLVCKLRKCPICNPFKCCLTIYRLSTVELRLTFLGAICLIGHIYIAISMNRLLASHMRANNYLLTIPAVRPSPLVFISNIWIQIILTWLNSLTFFLLFPFLIFLSLEVCKEISKISPHGSSACCVPNTKLCVPCAYIFCTIYLTAGTFDGPSRFIHQPI